MRRACGCYHIVAASDNRTCSLDFRYALVFNARSAYGAPRVNPTSNTKIFAAIAIPVLASILVLAATASKWALPPAMAEVADRVEALALPGDLVIVTPENRFPELYWFDDELDVVALDDIAPDVDRFDRVILVRPRSDHPPAMRRMLAGRGDLLLAEDVRRLTVELFQLRGRDSVTGDLAERLPEALVSIVPQRGEPIPCPWLGDRFDCAEAAWTWVGPTVQTFAGEPHGCVWMHPVADADLVVSYEDVEGTHVTGWYGLTDYAVSVPDGGPVRMRLTSGSQTGRFRAHDQRGRRPVRFRLPEGHDGTLEISVSASRPGVRHFCWDLQTVFSNEP